MRWRTLRGNRSASANQGRLPCAPSFAALGHHSPRTVLTPVSRNRALAHRRANLFGTYCLTTSLTRVSSPQGETDPQYGTTTCEAVHRCDDTIRRCPLYPPSVGAVQTVLPETMNKDFR